MQEGPIACQHSSENISTDIKLTYICPYWGREHLKAESFIDIVLANEFDGIETNLPETGIFSKCFIYKMN